MAIRFTATIIVALLTDVFIRSILTLNIVRYIDVFVQDATTRVKAIKFTAIRIAFNCTCYYFKFN